MSDTLDAIIIAGGWLKSETEASDEVKLRINRGVELFESTKAKGFITCGRGRMADTKAWLPHNARPSCWEIMADHAAELGVPKNRIFGQQYSMDLVGEAFFTKAIILEPHKLKRILVVTSKYNVPRAWAVFNHVLGPDYKTRFEGVPTALDADQKMLISEAQNLAVFVEQFGSVTAGDSTEIERILYEKHGIYSKLPSEERAPMFYSAKRNI